MLQALINFFESVGRARAAAHLANHGYYDLAKEIATSECERECIAEAQEVHP